MSEPGVPARTPFSRDVIDLEELKRLQAVFGADGELSEAEFIRAFTAFLDEELAPEDLAELFMKIDANSDGTVDWDEFTNYMFLEDNGTEDAEASEPEEPQKPGAARTAYSPAAPDAFVDHNPTTQHHLKDGVHSVVQVDRLSAVVTASRDAVRLWHAHSFAFLGALGGTGREWVTACVYMSVSNRLAVASLENTVCFYDMAVPEGRLCGKVPAQFLRQAAALCLGYGYDEAAGKEILTVGDDGGQLSIFILDERTWHLCDGSLECHDTTSGSRRVDMQTELARRRKQRQGVVVHRETRHTDHVTCVGYIPDLGCVISGSLDGTLKVVDLERMILKRDFRQHKKAVYDFVWCSDAKLVASCGLERHIILWSPYSRRIAKLGDQLSSVRRLEYCSADRRLVALGADGSVRVWDVRNSRCTQTLHDAEGMAGISAAAFVRLPHMPRPALVTASTARLLEWSPRLQTGRREHSHAFGCVTAMYNSNFHQVLSVDVRGNVSLWSGHDGGVVSQFSAVPLEERDDVLKPVELRPQITAACFDQGGRRLITGDHRGDCLRLWNFSNGSLLRSLLKVPEGSESSSSEGEEKEEESPRSRSPPPRSPPRSPPPPTPARPGTTPGQGGARTPSRPTRPGTTPARPGGRRGRNVVAEPTPGGIPPPTQLPPSVNTEAKREVTCVLSVVTSLPQVPGQPSIQNRYIVCAGWDRRVYMWRDGGGAAGARQGYVARLPEQLDAGVGHTDDVITAVFCPPTMIATGGVDGKVVLWHLNSREFFQDVQLGCAVEHLFWLDKPRLIVAALESGFVAFISPRTGALHSKVDAGHEPNESVVAVVADRSNQYMVSADSAGFVRVWDLLNPHRHDPFAVPTAYFRAAQGRIASVDYVENASLIDTFILVSSATGDVSMWTLAGQRVGTYGQPQPWSLETPRERAAHETRRASRARAASPSAGSEAAGDSSSSDDDDDDHPPDDQPAEVNVSRKRGFFVPSEDTNVALLRQQLEVQHVSMAVRSARLPEVGEVWVRARRGAPYTGGPDGVLTVTHVEPKRDLVKGWDGAATMRSSKLSDLTGARDRQPWSVNEELSRRIGCVFDSGAGGAFKVMLVIRTNGSWFVVDTEMEVHPVPEMARGAPYDRSVSRFLARRKHALALPASDRQQLEKSLSRAAAAAAASASISAAAASSSSSAPPLEPPPVVQVLEPRRTRWSVPDMSARLARPEAGGGGAGGGAGAGDVTAAQRAAQLQQALASRRDRLTEPRRDRRVIHAVEDVANRDFASMRAMLGGSVGVAAAEPAARRGRR